MIFTDCIYDIVGIIVSLVSLILIGAIPVSVVLLVASLTERAPSNRRVRTSMGWV